MSKEEIRALLRRNTEPDKQSITTAEGLEVARAAARALGTKNAPALPRRCL